MFHHLLLVAGASVLLVPQIAMGGFLDFFDFTPSPPIYDRPFAIGMAGSTVQLDLQIKKRTIWAASRGSWRATVGIGQARKIVVRPTSNSQMKNSRCNGI
jgi:hypothetical protein